MKKLLTKLNGYKTLIGAALAVVYIGSVSQGYIEANQTIEYILTAVFSVGLAHKAIKAS